MASETPRLWLALIALVLAWSHAALVFAAEPSASDRETARGCNNGVKDAVENDVDCGGYCGATCGPNQQCGPNGDGNCASGNCCGGGGSCNDVCKPPGSCCSMCGFSC